MRADFGSSGTLFAVVKRTFVGNRFRTVALLTGLLVGCGALVGCRRHSADAPAPSADSLKQSLAGLRKQLDTLTANFASLRQRVEAIPPDLDDFPEARARFFAAEEGRGVTDTGAVVLASRLDEAARSGNREELLQISADITRTSESVRKLDELYLKMMHQMMAFERMAEQKKQATAEAKPATPSTKTKRSKSKP
jgi:cell division protein FtsB